MTMKKILAAVAACAMAVSMLSLSVCAACIEDEGEDLEENDTAVSDTLDDEDEDEDIDLDDEDEDVEADVDDAEDTADVVNPGTGNAPIALAVIPVALAAAAVVAKKASK